MSKQQAQQVRITRRERGYRLESQQWLDAPIDRVFAFFSDAFQLETLTPAALHFHVLTPAPINIEEGTLIDYRLRVHGVPIRWQSRISQWQPSNRFVDEQVRGPYRYWHHQHIFTACDGGTTVEDIVDYAPLGGALAQWLLVGRDLRRIFAFRRAKLAEIFSNASVAGARVAPNVKV